jgi:hypothetical protein
MQDKPVVIAVADFSIDVTFPWAIVGDLLLGRSVSMKALRNCMCLLLNRLFRPQKLCLSMMTCHTPSKGESDLILFPEKMRGTFPRTNMRNLWEAPSLLSQRSQFNRAH